MVCRDYYDTCPRGVCECDKAMAMCVSHVMATGEHCPNKITIGDAIKAVRRMLKQWTSAGVAIGFKETTNYILIHSLKKTYINEIIRINENDCFINFQFITSILSDEEMWV